MSDLAKQHAGEYAANLAEDGMLLGLGTGSTAAWAITRLGERMQKEELNVTGVATSRSSLELARQAGIPLEDPSPGRMVDLYIDGADEADDLGRLIKGGGGALLREKIVAIHSQRHIIVIDPSKKVRVLGRAFPLPVEVVPFGHMVTARHIEGATRSRAVLRTVGGEVPFMTDNGGYVYDLHFESGIADPETVAATLASLVGVVEHGLFLGLCDVLVTGTEEGVQTKEIDKTTAKTREA